MITRLGQFGYGTKRYGNFAGKITSREIGLITRHSQFGYGAQRYGLFSDKGLTPDLIIARHGGDDAWRKEKKHKKVDSYLEDKKNRIAAVIAAYEGLLEPETPEEVVIEAKQYVQEVSIPDMDLARVLHVLDMWEAEIERRAEQDDEEALMLLI